MINKLISDITCNAMKALFKKNHNNKKYQEKIEKTFRKLKGDFER